MSQLAKFPLKNGGFLAVEVDAAEASGRMMRGSTPAEVLVTASNTFEAALENVRAAAEGILNELRSLAHPPDDVAVEFGVKMSAESGAIIAKLTGEANFKINLTWKKSPASK
jgi:hypothetical protein